MRGDVAMTRAGRTIGWRTILGLLLVPLVAAGVFLWGLWNPSERLDTVTAAVVNFDEPVTVDGQMVPLGRVLAAELIAGDAESNFTWVLTDQSDATAGIDDGRYATVVTIPENFSSAATSMSRGADEAETATIDIETSDRGRLLDSALSNIVTATATSVLNKQLGAQFVGGVFVGMTALGEGIGEAADGAGLLADGGAQLADGAAQLAGGALQLSDGTAQLAAGAGELGSGASGLAQGASELAAGVGELSVGASGLSVGANELAAGARDAAAGGAQLADGVAEYTGLVNTVVTGVIDQTGALLPYVQQLRELIAAIPPELWPADADSTQQQALESLDSLIAELTAAAGDGEGSQLWLLRQAGEDLSNGVRASAEGQAQLADGLTGFAGGLGEFAGGVGQVAGGASQLASGAGQLAGGASQLAGGIPALSDGASQLADGTAQLADGTRQAADGTRELADGLVTAASEIPAYSETQSERMAEIAVQPVEAVGGSDELFNASGVPLFAGIALWAGAFASFLMLAPLWRRTREAARGIGFITLRSALPAVGVGAAQGAILGFILPPLLGYDAGQWLGFLGLSLVAGIAFSLVNQGLSALFGGFGRFLAFVVLVVAFAIGVISTAPPLLQAIGDASPVGALFAGFQAIATGTSGAGGATALLIVWGLGGLALTAFAVARERRTITAAIA